MMKASSVPRPTGLLAHVPAPLLESALPSARYAGAAFWTVAVMMSVWVVFPPLTPNQAARVPASARPCEGS